MRRIAGLLPGVFGLAATLMAWTILAGFVVTIMSAVTDEYGGHPGACRTNHSKTRIGLRGGR